MLQYSLHTATRGFLYAVLVEGLVASGGAAGST